MRLLLITLSFFVSLSSTPLAAQASLKKVEKYFEKHERSPLGAKDLAQLHALIQSATQEPELTGEVKTWYLAARAYKLFFEKTEIYPAVGEDQAIEQVRLAGERAATLREPNVTYAPLAKTQVDLLYMELMTRGTNAYNEQQFDRALRSFEQAAMLKPKATDPLLYAATLAQETGQYPRAMALYEQLLQLAPADFSANFSYAYLLSWEAEKLYQQVNALSDEEYAQKGEALIKQGHAVMKKTLPHWLAARQAKPADKNTLLGLKTVYSRLGLTKELAEVEAKLGELGY